MLTNYGIDFLKPSYVNSNLRYYSGHDACKFLSVLWQEFSNKLPAGEACMVLSKTKGKISRSRFGRTPPLGSNLNRHFGHLGPLSLLGGPGHNTPKNLGPWNRIRMSRIPGVSMGHITL
jgi:hypothetical protein